jgi:hypothetical protein
MASFHVKFSVIRCSASIFCKVPKKLIVWDIIGKVNKKSLNATKFTHW